MANEVSIRVTIDDRTKPQRDIIRNGFATAGKEAGKEFSKGLDEEAKKGGRKAGEDAEQEAAKAAKAKAKSAAGDGGGGPSLLGTALFAGLPAAGAAAGAAAALGLGLGLAGAVYFVGATSKQVQDQLSSMGDDIQRTVKSWSTDLGPTVAKGVAQVHAEFDKLAPQIHSALVNVAPQFSTLISAMTDFADGAMPGVVSASSKLGPVFDGLRVAAGSLGVSVGGLFTTVSQHSSSIGTSLGSLGRIVSTLVDTAGPLIGKLSDEFAQHSGSIEGAVSSLGSTITGVSNGALPVLGTALGGDMRIISGFLNALGPADAALGSLGGAAFSAYTNVKLLGTLQGPIGGLSDKLKAAGTAGTTFGDLTTKAGTALGKLGSALPIVGVGLTLVGSLMELTQQHAQDLAASGEKVGQALGQGGAGALTAAGQIKQWQADASAAQKTMDSLAASQSTVTVNTAHGTLEQKTNTGAINEAKQALSDANTKINDALGAYNNYRNSIGLTNVSQDEFNGKVTVASNSAKNASSGLYVMAAAQKDLESNTISLSQRISDLNTVISWMGEGGVEKARDGLSHFYAAVDSAVQSLATAKGALIDFNGQLNVQTDKGRQARDMLETAASSMSEYVTNAAASGVPMATINGNLDAMRQKLYDTLDGLTGNKNEARQLVNQLIPINGTFTAHVNIDANAYYAGLSAVQQSLRVLAHGVTVPIFESSLGAGGMASAGRLAHGGVVGAASGRTLGSGLTIVGEQGPELIRAVAGSSVVPRSGVDKALQNTGASGSVQVSINFGGSTDSTFATAFMKLVRSGAIQIQSQYVK